MARAEALQVSGAIYPDFTRIAFNSTAAPSFQASLSGSNLHITFVSPVEANFHGMLKTLHGQITSASLEDGGKRISIKLKEGNVRLRKFRGQNFFGVDLVPQKKADVAEPQKIVPMPLKEAAKKPAEDKAKKEKAKAEAKAKATAAKEQEKKKAAEEKKKVEEAKKNAAQKRPKPEMDIKPKKEAVQKVEKVKLGKDSVMEPEVRTIIQKPEEVTRVMPTQANLLLVVPWEKMVSAAIYVRGENLWAVFDGVAQIPLTDVSKQYVQKAEQIPNRQSTILKLKLTPEIAKNSDWIWATRDQNDWVIYYAKPPQEKPILITTPEDTSENEIKFVVRHAAEPLQMLDPDIGDSLFIVPVRDSGNRVLAGRNFVEFSALPTVQGVVMVRRSDVPDYKVSREGVAVTSRNKLLTSPPVKATQVLAVAAGELEKRTMYPFTQNPNDDNFMPTYYKYLKDIQAEPEVTRSPLHLKMAEHYFLNGFYAESLGLLRDILVDDPEFAAKAGIKPMISGALFMMGRYDQSADAFYNIVSNKEMPEYAEEQKLWYWASLKMMEQQYLIPFKPIEGFDNIAALNTYLPSYPYALRRKLLLLYIQDLLKDSRTGSARKLIKEVAMMGPTQEESEMLDFSEAMAQLSEKKNDLGLERLGYVMQNATSGRVRTLALLETTRIEKEAGKKPLPEIIKALELAKLGWRGDNVEFQLLQRLGQYYFENKQYAEGLRTWRELVTQFSGTTESLRVAGDMANQFAALFDTNGAAYTLPPVQALSLFFEFNELMPVGEKGDHISRNLADFMASVDLLDNAAAILTHQVRFRSQGEDRAQLATKLIDLHLASNRPDLAQEVMGAMAREKIPDNLKEKFQLLNAEIAVQQGKYPEALKILAGQNSKAANDMQLAILWKEQEWEKVIDVLQPMVKARAESKDSLKPYEEESALRLGISYSKLRRFDDLKWLRTAYNDRIKKPEIDEAMDFVTQSTNPIDHEALERSLEMDKVNSFLSKYRLPEPPPPPPAPEPKVEEKPSSPNLLPEEEGKEKPKEEKKKE